MEPSITKELLFKYFAGQVTALQKQQIEEWAKNPEHEEFFYSCLHEWELKNPQYQTDVPLAIEKFNRFLVLTAEPILQAAVSSRNTFSSNKRKWIQWGIAASLLLILAANAWLFRDRVLYQKYVTAYGATKSIQLSDGSTVILNANSSLSIPRFGFGASTRLVYLKGEANFSVVHTPDHKQFIVQTDPLFNVQVLGTEFTVSARTKQTKVVLTKGKVQVQYKQETQQARQVTMAPGDLVILDKQQGRLRKERVAHPEDYASWQNHRFVFDNTSLVEVCELLRETYGLQVEIRGERLKKQTLTGSFKARSVDEWLQALSDILQINVNRKDNRVLLTE
ncbi:DUF4974 domain-containing protein [Rhodocytophaga rosea]|uniref:DUF4974 domain-containing protein n=1 Tax=Rhodocytophaga rosea TaxID=2704465 RepID=A0A6C0GTG9_9BACT|nr:FecR domain-containing protein [Rhodocytophaga rosea]QHT71468.1 DUF4974 domain-containing protein [Rhodocytophaga rosea]